MTEHPERRVDERERALRSREGSVGVREDHLAAMEAALHEADAARAEARRLHADLRDANEHLVLASLHAQQLTDAANVAHRRQEEFLAMMAHELRNPLAAIGNAVGVLSRYTDRAPALARVHEIAARQVRHMTRLLDDLLDVSRLTRGSIVLRTFPIALADVIPQAVELCRNAIDARGLQLRVDLPAEAIGVDGDAMRLVQVFGNLLHNAAKYTPAGGAIRIELEGSGAEAVVRVIDNGIGIAADMLGSVFDLFTQESQMPEHATGGLGIGLSVVRDLVALHGGKVEVHSAGRGQGSEFAVTLPALASLPAASAEPARAAVLPPQTFRILLIDDNVDSTEALAVLLRMDGHEVSVALDGKSALEMARRTLPQIVLCDIGLPGMDGHAVAELLLEQQCAAPPLMIAVTGYGHAQARARSLAAGFAHHLVKPVEIDALLQLIATSGKKVT